MRKFFLLGLIIFTSCCLQVFADDAEEYKSDLMIRGYEFSNDGLSEAIIKNDKEAISLFVKADININLPDNEGYSALDRALKLKDEDAVMLLSQAGGETKLMPNPKIQNNVDKPKGKIENDSTNLSVNKLCELVNSGKLDEVANKAKNSSELNVLSSEGLAPIHYAVFNDDAPMANVLLQNGADVNIRTSDGLTPLDIAVLNNQKVVAKELLEYGGGLSVQVARELMKFGCETKYDEAFELYDAAFDDIFATMAKIQVKIDSQK